MSQILEELNQIITTSDLPLEDQNDILVVLPALPEKVIQTPLAIAVVFLHSFPWITYY